jgi:Leucine-rich repeat (LRR) protein
MSHAPLLQLQLSGVPLAPFAAWLQQRGQLGQLQRLELKGWLFPDICYGVHSLLGQGPSHFDQSWDWLTSLAGLQEMRLEVSDQIGIPPVLGTAHLQPGLADLRHLTQLSVKGFQLGADLHQSLSALTHLKQLQLAVEDQRVDLSWEWLTALRQLTHLDLSPTPVEQLPEELGEALPHLEVLLVQDCFLEALPKGLTRLSHLDASITDEPDDEYNNDGLEALCDATALRRLNLSGCGITTTRHLAGLQKLEVLQLRGAKRLCECVTEGAYCGHCFKTSAGSDDSSDSEFDSELWGQPPPPLDLPRAVNLRHLDLRSGEWWVQDLVAAGPLQHLTYLDLGDAVAYHQQHSDARHLPDLGVLPSLQQLNLGGITIERRDWSRVGAWLGLQTQLTRLSLRGTRPVDIKPSRAASQGMAHLPTQLVELDVRDSDLQQLPKRLSQLTGLKVLLLGGNRRLPRDLPRWLPALQQLEVLEVGAMGTAKAAGRLLQQLPALRQFSVSHGANGPSSGEEQEPAQQLYEQLPHLQRVGPQVLEFGLFGQPGLEPCGQD